MFANLVSPIQIISIFSACWKISALKTSHVLKTNLFSFISQESQRWWQHIIGELVVTFQTFVWSFLIQSTILLSSVSWNCDVRNLQLETCCSLLRTHLASYLKSSAALGDHVHEQVDHIWSLSFTAPTLWATTFISSLVNVIVFHKTILWATKSSNRFVISDLCHKSNQKCWGPLPLEYWSHLIIVIYTTKSKMSLKTARNLFHERDCAQMTWKSKSANKSIVLK